MGERRRAHGTAAAAHGHGQTFRNKLINGEQASPAGALKMGVARHDHVTMPLGHARELLLQSPQQTENVGNLLTQVEPDIEQHLIIATASRV